MAKKNYAMPTICWRHEGYGEPAVRRVLIRYEGRPKTKLGCKFYNSVKLVAVDPYFKHENASHKYQLFDDGYILADCNYKEQKEDYEKYKLLGEKRQYHTLHLETHTWHNGKPCTPIIFKANSDEEATKIFNERIENR